MYSCIHVVIIINKASCCDVQRWGGGGGGGGGGYCCASQYNTLRDVFALIIDRAWFGGQLEVGHGYGGDSPHSRPADILVPNWMIGNPVANKRCHQQ